jgi:hypothetical protein
VVAPWLRDGAGLTREAVTVGVDDNVDPVPWFLSVFTYSATVRTARRESVGRGAARQKIR